MLFAKKIHTRNLITKKNSCRSKIPPPPFHNFSNGPSLIARAWNSGALSMKSPVLVSRFFHCRTLIPCGFWGKLKPSRRKWLNYALNNKQTYKRLYKQLERFPATSKWSALTSTTTVIYIKTRIINKNCQSEFTVSRLWETKLRGLRSR